MGPTLMKAKFEGILLKVMTFILNGLYYQLVGPKTEFNTSLLGDLDLYFSGSNYDPYPTS